MKVMKTIALTIFAVVLLPLGVLAAGAPTTVLHVVTVKWKADSTPAQQQAAIEGIRKMAADVPGLKNIWVKKVKAQPADFSTVFAMEFDSAAAFDAYTNNAAHKNWEKIYLPIREESQTQDVTN